MSKTTLFKAFPLGNQVSAWQDGMDLRDYFAAKAVPFLLKYITTGSVLMNEDFLAVAKDSYKLADAMMEVRYDTK